MSAAQLIKVKIRPGRVLSFPGLCVYCGQPAAERLPLRRRIGRITRFIDVPLCEECAGVVARRSWAEERMIRFGWLAAGGSAFILLFLMLILLPGELAFLLRLATAAALAVLVALAVWTWFKRRIAEAALPEKKAVLQAARIANFSWRATTFAFDNELFARRFAEMNKNLLMEF